MYNERFQGRGLARLGRARRRLPAQPQAGFPGNYLVQPAVNRAFDNFWANAAGPGGVGIGDRYAAAWRQVGSRFGERRRHPRLRPDERALAGQRVAAMARTPPVARPSTRARFAQFYRRTLTALRAGDARHLAFYEPNLIFNDGADTQLPKFDDPRLALSWHNYCLVGGRERDGWRRWPGLQHRGAAPVQKPRSARRTTGDATLLTEFGATDDL